MPRKQYQYHYIYKTTNILNNKFYIGMHSTNNFDDGYQGSGRRLGRSINKHGKENHVTEILEYLPDRESLRLREMEFVNKELINEDLCMNLAVGGQGINGSWEYANIVITRKQRIKNGKKSGEIHKQRLINDPDYKQRLVETATKNILQAHEDGKVPHTGMKGKHHSKETKRKMRNAKKGQSSGQKNSQFGLIWIYSNKKQKSIKIKTNELEEWKSDGWTRGRKIKFNNPIEVTCKQCNKKYIQKNKELYCSKTCRYPTNNNALAGREDEFLKCYYKNNMSMNAALKSMGFIGAVGGYYYLANKILTQI